jgi:hypothetical protein
MEYRIFAWSDTTVQPVSTRFSTCKKRKSKHAIVLTRKKINKTNGINEPLPNAQHCITYLYVFRFFFSLWRLVTVCVTKNTLKTIRQFINVLNHALISQEVTVFLKLLKTKLNWTIILLLCLISYQF